MLTVRHRCLQARPDPAPNDGRARAMADGVRFGRKSKLTKHQAREALSA
jgi:hypothetical protein